MASKSGQETASTEQVEELLDAVDLTLDRLKTMYEQYFLGIQKQAPAFIHNDVERKLRDLTQLNIRNTGLRYRLATLTQKFGSYNSYWRRTLRQIENGTYGRNLAKIGREAARTGSEIPEEILAAMPKRMREQVLRDRDQALAIAKRRQQVDEGAAGEGAQIEAAPAKVEAPKQAKTASGAHVLEDEGDIDFNELFSAFDDDAPKADSIKPARSRSGSQAPATQRGSTSRPPPLRMPVPSQAAPRAAATPSAATASPVPPVGQSPSVPTTGATPPVGQAIGAIRLTQQPVPRPTGAQPSGAAPRPVGAQPSGSVPQAVGPQASGGVPRPIGAQPSGAAPRPVAPSQQSRPVPVIPGSASQSGPIPVETMSGPFPRPPSEKSGPTPTTGQRTTGSIPAPPTGQRTTGSIPKPPTAQPAKPAAPLKPPPGMTDADVNVLHAKYVKAKEMVGEKVDPGSREKLLKTINQTAPKIMEQYKASGVDFSVVVKDNQVVIKAKPKT